VNVRSIEPKKGREAVRKPINLKQKGSMVLGYYWNSDANKQN
jgi:hypothetical protein